MHILANFTVIANETSFPFDQFFKRTEVTFGFLAISVTLFYLHAESVYSTEAQFFVPDSGELTKGTQA